MVIKIIIALFVFGIVSLLWSNYALRVRRYEIKGKNNLKILLISDLHKKKFGKNYERLLKKIPKEKHDFICFVGDLLSRGEYKTEEKIHFLENLKKIAPVFFVSGNHEVECPDNYGKLKDGLTNIGVDNLDNKSIFYKNGEENTVIAGFSSEKRFFRNERNGFSGLYKIDFDYLKEKIGPKDEKNYTVLLSHTPFFFEQYAEWGADLTLCGHVHGGVVRIPFYRGILSPERKFFPKYDGGVFEKNGKIMVVSRGLGKIRLFNPSEIVVIDIKKE